MMPSETQTTERRRLQISLGVMLLLMLVFGLISAGLLYASRVPAVQQEWATLIDRGGVGAEPQSSGHIHHLAFILFTFASPLILATVLSTMLAILRRVRTPRRAILRDSSDRSIE